jgi:hypothetical protein
MEGMSAVTEFELFRRTGDMVLLQFETTEPPLLAPMQGPASPSRCRSTSSAGR